MSLTLFYKFKRLIYVIIEKILKILYNLFGT